ncbi:DUF2474 domain-containing protein [Pararobbsia alpina]|uniref:DUF2474 domain-containing protein n=1 Tax=Pararobbsia alpina TaxID=621374 RepID=A0A6S7BJ89_9BURK|nr:DUF2474 domain-containing protein [Pararobbsia alpina]CAB3800873.1 hypothetical protein LMG28138_04922 [Pararobbsia alpina]
MDDTPAIERARASRHPRPGPLRRLGWFVLIWAASVAALGVVALVIRMLMGLTGMRVG